MDKKSKMFSETINNYPVPKITRITKHKKIELIIFIDNKRYRYGLILQTHYANTEKFFYIMYEDGDKVNTTVICGFDIMNGWIELIDLIKKELVTIPIPERRDYFFGYTIRYSFKHIYSYAEKIWLSFLVNYTDLEDKDGNFEKAID